MNLISRQDAIKAIEDLPNCYNGFSDTYDKACIIGVIEEVPSAQPDRDLIHLQKEQAYLQGWSDKEQADLSDYCDKLWQKAYERGKAEAWQWIPCSERLPEDGRYLCTTSYDRTIICNYAQNLRKVDEYDFPKKKSGWYNFDSEYGYYEETGIVAWMPLPESYKGEQ